MMQNIDTGLSSLIIVARHFGIPADIRQLERAYALEKGPIDSISILRAGQDLKLKVRRREGVAPARLATLPMPAIAKLKNGNYIVIIGMDGQKLGICDPLLRPEPIEAATSATVTGPENSRLEPSGKATWIMVLVD